MRAKRVLLILLALLGAGIGFSAPSQAATSPVITMVVDCAQSTPTSSSGPTLDAPAGVYVATVVGGCLTHVRDVAAIPVSTPCGVGSTAIPCLTGQLSNLPSELCGGSVGAAFVDLCGLPAVPVTLNGCSLTVTVDGQCLTAGTTGQVVHGGGPVTARFEDSNWDDNYGYFLVVLRPAV